MAIQTSLRVRKTFANKLSSTSTSSGRLLMLFVSDTVPVPASSDEVRAYCDSVLNYSPNYGGGSGNRANVLAWTLVLPGSVTELSQANDLAMLTSNRTITASNTGRIGSVMIISPLVNSTAVALSSQYNHAGSMTTCLGFTTSTSISPTNDRFGLPEALSTNASYQGYAQTYYNGLHSITDSVGLQASSAFLKTSSLDLVSGATFTLYGFSLKAVMAS